MAELRPTAIHGYCDRLSVAPGEPIEFKVSSEEGGTFRADIVRLIHGDTNPAGPGFMEEVLETEANGDYPARFQATDCGSCVVVDDGGALALDGPFTLHAFVMPTTPGIPGQGIMGRYATDSRSGYALRHRGRRAGASDRRRDRRVGGAVPPVVLVLGRRDLRRCRLRHALLAERRQLDEQPPLADRADLG